MTKSSVSETKTDANNIQGILVNDTENENLKRTAEEQERDEKNHNMHLYVVIEQEEGKILPVSFEMLGEGRRLMDNFNSKYNPKENVVAIILGHNIKHLCQELIYHGADAVICADHPELRYPRNLLYTKIISQIATDKSSAAQISSSNNTFNKPRYMFFSADDTGRHLSSTVLAELESGLASDINKLVINDLEIDTNIRLRESQSVTKRPWKCIDQTSQAFFGLLYFVWIISIPKTKKNFILRHAA